MAEHDEDLTFGRLVCVESFLLGNVTVRGHEDAKKAGGVGVSDQRRGLDE